MPKVKTHSGMKKRIHVTADGQFKRGHSAHSHLLTKKKQEKKKNFTFIRICR